MCMSTAIRGLGTTEDPWLAANGGLCGETETRRDGCSSGGHAWLSYRGIRSMLHALCDWWLKARWRKGLGHHGLGDGRSKSVL